MRLKSRDLIFIAIVVFVVGGLWYLSTRNKAKPMPPTPAHMTAKSREECFQCHLPAKFAELELQHKHPGKWRDERVSCLLCHKPPQETKVQNLSSREANEFANLLRRSKSGRTEIFYKEN